ncbi:MAG: hypothetical protein GEU99_05855 [Luteitalea sp.]|nr:hypothetical protein [Luteitalea sp.]
MEYLTDLTNPNMEQPRESGMRGGARDGPAATNETVGSVLVSLVRSPGQRLIRHWNWKAALLSASFRSVLFFLTNLSAGLGAAVAAMLTELGFRGSTAGFYGALTQAFRHAQPSWLATLTVMLLLPTVAHAVELLVHWYRGTERLGASILASCLFTALSTVFNLFAMRQGALIVGDGRQSLADDLRRMPRLIAAFIIAIVAGGRRRRASRNWRG